MLRTPDTDKAYFKLLNRSHASGSALPSVLDILEDAVCLFDNSFRLSWWNIAFKNLYFLSKLSQEPWLISVYDLMNEPQKELFAHQLELAKDGCQGNFEWECNTGLLQWLNITLHPLKDDDQKVIGIIGVVRNSPVKKSLRPAIMGFEPVITPKKSTNDFLRKSNEELTEKITVKTAELSGILERITDAFMALDVDWNYSYVNKKAEELHGRKKEELVGKNIWEEFPDVVSEPFYQCLQEAMLTQQPVRKELYYSTTRQWFENFVYPSVNGVTVYYHDITEKKIAEQDLRNSEEKYRYLVEQAADAIIISDLEGNYVDVNSVVTSMTGYSKNELAAMTLFDLLVLGPEEPPLRIDELLEGKSVLQERKVRRKDGTVFFAELSNKLIPGNLMMIIGRDITERKKAESLIKENELRWKLALEKSELGVWELDFEKKAAFISEKTKNQTGYSNDEEITKPHIWYQAIYEEDRPAVVSKFINTLKGVEPSFDAEFRVVCKNGSIKWFRFVGNVISRNTTGYALRMIGVHEDITERVARENDLKLKEKAIESSLSGIGITSLDGTITYVNNAIIKMWGAKDSSELVGKNLVDVFEGDRVYKTIGALQSQGFESGEDTGKRVDGSVFPVEFTANVIADEKGIPQCLYGSFIDISERKEAQDKLAASETLFREITENSPSGIILLDKEYKFKFISTSARRITGYLDDNVVGLDPASFTHPDDLRVLLPQLLEMLEIPGKVFTTQYRFLFKDGSWHYLESTFSNLLDIKGVEAISVNFRDIHQERIALLKLRQSEKRFRAFFEHSMDGIVIGNEAGDILAANKAAQQAFGRTEEEIILAGRSGLVDTADIALAAKLKERSEKGFAKFEINFFKKDGTKFPVELTSSVYRDLTGSQKSITIFRDISDRKIAEQKIINERMLSDSLINNLPGIFYLYTIEGKFIRWNKNFETLSGYSSNEIANMHPLDFHEGAEKKRLQERLGKIFKMQVPGIELVLTAKNKRNIPFFINSMAIMYEGIPCVIGTGNDITRRKKAEQDLIESEAAFQRLFEESSEAILLLDGTSFIDCNKSTLSLLGYSSKDVFLNKSPWDISPEYQPDGKSSIKKAKEIIAKTLKKGYYRFEWIHKKADGSEVPVEVMLTPVIIKGKQLIYTVWHDITKRKIAEEELRKSMKEISDYKYALDESATVSFADEEGTITYVNDKFCKLYGYKKEEIVGQNHRVLNSNVHPASFWQHFWQTIQKGKVLKAEVCNKGKDGTLHWSDTTIIPFAGDNGRPYQYLAIRFDITEKRQLEEDLARQQKLEQIRITETALEAQEKERNYLGQELHDNVNQILVGTKLLLSIVRDHPEENNNLVGSCVDNLQHAIDENRKLSHSLVTPDLNLQSLAKQLRQMTHEMFFASEIAVTIESKEFKEKLLDKQRKIAIYRIAQEQCTNIIKYAKAKNVTITLRNENGTFHMKIADDGQGMEAGKATDGIGIRNIKGRVSIFGGKASIDTKPGKGFALLIEIPIK